ncbi:MAG: lactate racemase domain-containing protein, partial [Calditrichaceae bacterium]
MKNAISCRQNAWYGDDKISYRFPANWNISVFSPKNTIKLSDDDIFTKIQNPLGCLPLSKQLKPGMKVLIISDDITRPTRTDIIIPVLLNILKNAGIRSGNISILIGTGLHSLMSDHDKTLKFGKDIVDNFKIYDHDYRGKNIYAGKTRSGTPVFINKHVSESDFVIGVGGIYPHNPAGFGGGAKLILGVCSEKTIKYFHMRRKGVGAGGTVSNEFRQDLLEASRLAGMNFIINNLVDKDRNIIEILSGDVDTAYHAGVKKARKIFGVPNPVDHPFDLVVADAYPFDSTFAFTRKGWWPIRQCGRNSYKLIISSILNGIGNHPLFPTVPVRFPMMADIYNEYLTSGIIDFIFGYS